MRKFLYAGMIVLAMSLGSQAIAQFKPQVVVNGVTYTATTNTPIHVTYVQQDFLDFTLAADSFYIDVMTIDQWDFSSSLIVQSGGVFSDGMYHLPNGCQVFVSDETDPITGDLMIVRLFGSEE
jgi:hypothetical protein